MQLKNEKSKKKCIFFTNLSLFNLGCEAILRGTVKILNKTNFSNLSFIMPSYRVKADRERLADLERFDLIPMSISHGIRRVINRKFGLFYKKWIPRFSPVHFNPSEILVSLSVGGDMYTLYNNDLPWELIKFAEFSVNQFVPFAIWGATMESFEKRVDLFDYILGHLKLSCLITVRDQGTLKYLEKFGIKKNVKEVADPAFCMDSIECEIEPFFPKIRTKYCAGLNLSPLSQRYTPNLNLIFQGARAVEKYIERTDQSIVLVPHVFTPRKDLHYDDLAFHEKIFFEIKRKFKPFVGFVNKDLGAPRMKYLISKLDAFVGTRMHSTIASLSSSVPTISLPYSEKGFYLNDMIFPEDKRWVIPIGDFSPELFSSKMVEIFYSLKEIRTYLSPKISEIKQKAMLGGKFLFEKFPEN